MALYQPGSVEEGRTQDYLWENARNRMQFSQETMTDYMYRAEAGGFNRSGAHYESLRSRVASLGGLSGMTAEANPINQNAFVQGYFNKRLGQLEGRISSLEAVVIS